MKKLLLILACATLLSCHKNTICYHCIFGTVNGVTPPPVDYCGDDGGGRSFKDANGNDLQSKCVMK